MMFLKNMHTVLLKKFVYLEDIIPLFAAAELTTLIAAYAALC